MGARPRVLKVPHLHKKNEVLSGLGRVGPPPSRIRPGDPPDSMQSPYPNLAPVGSNGLNMGSPHPYSSAPYPGPSPVQESTTSNWGTNQSLHYGNGAAAFSPSLHTPFQPEPGLFGTRGEGNPSPFTPANTPSQVQDSRPETYEDISRTSSGFDNRNEVHSEFPMHVPSGGSTQARDPRFETSRSNPSTYGTLAFTTDPAPPCFVPFPNCRSESLFSGQHPINKLRFHEPAYPFPSAQKSNCRGARSYPTICKTQNSNSSI